VKTTIRADGTLHVTPETELEAYALNQWGKANFGSGFETRIPEIKIIVDMSAYDIDTTPLRCPTGVRP
jgi:hypothetical protein